MKDYRQLIRELPSKTIVLACAKFNPPTSGHELLVKAVKTVAEQRNANYVIYASDLSDAKKNPLLIEKKLQYLTLLFPNTNFVHYSDNLSEVVSNLKETYRNVIVVTSADKVASMKRSLKEATVVSAYEKDPDADDSARALATKGLYEQFKKTLPSTIREIDSRRLMNDVRVACGLEPIKEEIKLVQNELREKYFRGEIFKLGDIVESDDKQYEIVKRGSNHLLLKEESGKLVTKWIHNVKMIQESYTRISHHPKHKEITHGESFTIKIGKEHHEPISKLQHGEHHVFNCMDNREWHAIRMGHNLHFVAHPDDVRIHTNYHPNIPHTHFTGEEEYKDEEKPTFVTLFAKDLPVPMMEEKKERKKLKSFKSTARNLPNMAAVPPAGQSPQDFRDPYDPMSSSNPSSTNANI